MIDKVLIYWLGRLAVNTCSLSISHHIFFIISPSAPLLMSRLLVLFLGWKRKVWFGLMVVMCSQGNYRLFLSALSILFTFLSRSSPTLDESFYERAPHTTVSLLVWLGDRTTRFFFSKTTIISFPLSLGHFSSTKVILAEEAKHGNDIDPCNVRQQKNLCPEEVFIGR